MWYWRGRSLGAGWLPVLQSPDQWAVCGTTDPLQSLPVRHIHIHYTHTLYTYSNNLHSMYGCTLTRSLLSMATLPSLRSRDRGRLSVTMT